MSQGEHLFGDVGSRIADPLQLGNDMVHGHELAQIPGHRLEQGDQAHAFPIDGLLQAIEGAVPGDHLPGQARVPGQHGLDAVLHGGGRQARQLHQAVLYRG